MPLLYSRAMSAQTKTAVIAPPEDVEFVSIWGLDRYILPRRLADGTMSGWFASLVSWKQDGQTFYRLPTDNETQIDALTGGL